MYYVYVNDVYAGETDDAAEGYQIAFKYCEINNLSCGAEVTDAKIRFKNERGDNSELSKL